MRVARGFDVLREVASAQRADLSATRHRARAQAIELAHAEGLSEPAYSYRIVPLDAPATEILRVGGEILHASKLLPESGELTALACAVCTLDARLERRVGSLFAERRAALALALDELGNELLMAVSRRAQDRIMADVRRRGLTLSGELRAGDPGLALEAQAAVLRLAQAELIGGQLTGGQLMNPIKSTSMVLGVGIDLPPAQWSRCDDCSRRSNCSAVVPMAAEAL